MEAPVIDLERYRRLRKMLRTLQDGLVATIPRSMVLQCARELGMLEGRTFVYASNTEGIILSDYCIYSHWQQGRSLVEKYLGRLPPAHDPDERNLREAMRHARFSIFRVEEVTPGTGLVLRDLVRGDTRFLVDEMQSRTVCKTALVCARVLPLPDYWTSTGAGFPVTESMLQALQASVLPELKSADGELSTISSEAEEKLATAVIREALKEGVTSRVEYR